MNSLVRTSLFSAAVVAASVAAGLAISCDDSQTMPPVTVPTATPDLAEPTVYPDLATPVLPVPTLTLVSPATGSTAGGTLVTLKGSNFQNNATVTFGGTAATMVKLGA